MNETEETSTPDLVREFAQLKVWFAVNEVSHKSVAGDAKHRRLKAVVTELRTRGVLDMR